MSEIFSTYGLSVQVSNESGGNFNLTSMRAMPVSPEKEDEIPRIMGVELKDDAVWVCINGQCVFRARGFKHVHLSDGRTTKPETHASAIMAVSKDLVLKPGVKARTIRMDPCPPRFPYEGSISTGTLRPQDLMEAFLPVFKDIDAAEYAEFVEGYDNVFDTDTESMRSGVWEDNGLLREEADDMLECVVDRLNALCPDNVRFGAHEGDGADFGFWPCDEEDEGLTEEELDDPDIEKIAEQIMAEELEEQE